ncbi:unnamed protein product, partial [Rotaria magnacalcarata]
ISIGNPALSYYTIEKKNLLDCRMSSFLKDLPCRNPESFTKLRSVNAVCQTSVRPTYTAKLDTNVKEIINDPIPLLIHNLSRLQKDKPKKRPIPDDESTTQQRQPSTFIDYDEEFS